MIGGRCFSLDKKVHNQLKKLIFSPFEGIVKPQIITFPNGKVCLKPTCLGFSHFSGFLHYFVLAKLAIYSIRVKVELL